MAAVITCATFPAGGRTSSMWHLAAAAFSLFIAVGAVAAEIPLSERHSGYADMTPETKAMQDDDTANPGMLAVLDGETLWNTKIGNANHSCADCHGDARSSMKGVAARYPAFEASLSRAINLDQRINLCRERHQKASALAYESKDMLALSAYLGLQSRGEKIAPPEDGRLRRFLDAGRERFEARQGQLNLACTHCHNDNWGKKLAGNTIPQGHPNGYPLYRLEWQSLGSLHRRLRNCMIGIRAEPYLYGAPEYVELELYLMWRARGMTIETPAVRP